MAERCTGRAAGEACDAQLEAACGKRDDDDAEIERARQRRAALNMPIWICALPAWHRACSSTADGIALLLRNDIPFSEASCAAQTFGACALPINWHFKADEIA